MDILANMVIALLITSTIALIVINIKTLMAQMANNRIQMANNKKLEALCNGLYNEYKKVKGSEWATNAVREIIKDVVKKAV